MEVNVRERNGVTILDVYGEIIGSNSLKLEGIIAEHLLSTEGEVKILLNLAHDAHDVLASMNISLWWKKDGVTFFDVQCEIIGSESLALEGIIAEHISSAEGEVKILLNLTEVIIADNYFLYTLASMYTSVWRKKGRMVLKLGESTRQLIAAANLMTIFEIYIYDDEDEAVASFASFK